MRFESIYAQRPESAYRCIVSDAVLGTVFRNYQGWCWAKWGEAGHVASGVCGTKEAAIQELAKS